MVMQRWDAAREMRQLENTFDRLWRGFGRGWPVAAEQWMIPVDVIQRADELEVKASLPGVDPEKIDVSIEDNVLTIQAESSSETETKEHGYLVRERSFGSFYRALSLPESIDPNKVVSKYNDGVLSVVMPKAEEKKKKQIKVSTTTAKAIETTGTSKK